MFVVEDLGPQALKGVRDPVTLYRVVRPSGVRGRLNVAAGRLTRFVGREAELAALIDRWKRARDGEGQTVLIVGEAGVGKSRLAYQLRERLAAVPHTWLECGAAQFTESTPFHPVIALVSQGLAFSAGDTSSEKLKKLEGGLSALASTENAVENLALMAEFLGLRAPTQLAMSSELKRLRTIELLGAWTLALSELQPLVLLLEDLHWCDPSSLELLGRLIVQSATARVMLLATARPEFASPWPASFKLTTVQLPRLTKREAQEMVATLGGSALPADTLEALIARADGVPLYVEELTKVMIEPGAARGVEAIPGTLADSLMGRLDRLSAAKEVAQRAAVLGRDFPYALLAAVAGLEDATLRHGLARLVEAEILFSRGAPPDTMYTFKHALVQEAAYDSMLKRTRQQLHGRVVDVLMATFPQRAAAEPEVVARHAELAGRIDEAIAACQRAGEQAQARSAHQEAIRHLQHAIALLATQLKSEERAAREIPLQLALGESLGAARGLAHIEAGDAYERARVLAEATDDARGLGLALGGLAVFSLNTGSVERASALGARVLALAGQSGDTGLVIDGHFQVGAAELYEGKYASSLVHFEAARTLYQPGRHYGTVREDPGPAILGWIAWSLWAAGWPDRAIVRSREAVALARQLGYSVALAEALFFGAAVNYLRRDFTAQRECASETIALSEAHGFPLYLGIGKGFHASARVATGEPEAIADLMAGFALGAETGSEGGAPALFALLGEAYVTAGQLIEARGTVETGLAIAAQTGQLFFDSELHRLQGEIALKAGGSPAEAEAFFRQALEVARAQEAKSFELRQGTCLARLLDREGKREEARAMLKEIYNWFTEGFDTADLKDAKALLEELNA
jgi:tetratricopeptide (TPR) repeat protein